MTSTEQNAAQLALLHGPQVFVFLQRMHTSIPKWVPSIDVRSWFLTRNEAERTLYVCQTLGWIEQRGNPGEYQCSEYGGDLINQSMVENRFVNMFKYNKIELEQLKTIERIDWFDKFRQPK